jgi:hypothetical protein
MSSRALPDNSAADDPVDILVEQHLERRRESERPLAAQGNTPLPYLMPLASFSVNPAYATSGSV